MTTPDLRAALAAYEAARAQSQIQPPIPGVAIGASHALAGACARPPARRPAHGSVPVPSPPPRGSGGPVSVFTESDLVALRAQPRHIAARMLLTGEVGPLRRLVAGTYDPPGAAVAYLVFLAYVYGRARSSLAAVPGLSARARTLRTRAALHRSGGLTRSSARPLPARR